MRHKLIYLFCLFLIASAWKPLAAQELSAREIVAKADQKVRGETSQGSMKMTIIRPTWTREMSMKTWSKGTDYSLILVTGPARDKGTATLKRDKEIWNWQPSIDRVIKLPPSMMMQSWLGSDFTNDDLVRESSVVEDYAQRLLGSETIDGLPTYKIELIPNEDAPVVWGKVIVWIDKTDFIQLKTEFYDEDGYLVNTMLGKNIKVLGGKKLASRMEVIPAEEEGHKTVVEYLSMEFDQPISENFFSLQNLKRVK
ncbi:outer membrane lipoprotein-sorting protein [Flavilitoribacter nigricans]|uniref:Outer membrane lipoprotein-sorting protein n=1 Tax=Flavilitoribacter nigricans (strain ATCC 23147 / DSM 23189 / NBRC 102662 / NCIMB 1420 / SS-2) TaxID=1122177 RepID=A0A2D0ND11_FLAN2|nr:outer membrane lipoprotein-sorting protein [Flavilitoribacter nigricans]PHN06288.1 outer membrane lipoprotein-sorting protein [Flavilitoribacter nigricans DSM 23189 = NBRC 102662]